MNKLSFSSENKFFARFKNIFSFAEAANHLYKNKNGIIIILSHYKAKDWPRKRVSFKKEAEQIPLIWALFHANSDLEIVMDYGIHPTKCLPQLYNDLNPNSKRYRNIAYKMNDKTLGGCGTNVFILGNEYSSCQKTTQYCSAFGLPDDCFDKSFEKKMILRLKEYRDLTLWSFERTDYFGEKIDPFFNINYMWEGFLPSLHFFYVDKSGNFLRGLFRARDLEALNKEIWYLKGRAFVNEMEISNHTSPLFEEDYTNIVKRRLLHEFIRQQLLLMNKDEISSSYSLLTPIPYQMNKKTVIEEKINNIISSVVSESTGYLNSFFQEYGKKIDLKVFKKARFLVMDLEFIRVLNPVERQLQFIRNFPSVISNVIWHGPRKRFSTHINVLFLPCLICKEQPCNFFKKKAIKFDCLHFANEFVNREKRLLEDLFSSYENFKIYSFGQSDIYELECAINFVTDSPDYVRFERKNRVIKKRLIEVHYDLADQETSLKKVEKTLLETWFSGWSRKYPHIPSTRLLNINDSTHWKRNLKAVFNACISDAISCLLLLIYKEFRERKSNSFQFGTLLDYFDT